MNLGENINYIFKLYFLFHFQKIKINLNNLYLSAFSRFKKKINLRAKQATAAPEASHMLPKVDLEYRK